MRLVAVAPYYSEWCEHQLATLFAADGVEVLRLHDTGGPRLKHVLKAIWKGLTWSPSYKPSAVFSYFAWPQGIAGAILAIRFGCPHIVYELLSPMERILRLPLARKVLDEANIVAGCSPKYAAGLEKMIGRPVHVLRCPVYAGPDDAKPNGRVVFSAGSDVFRKGIDKLVTAASMLPNYHFRIAGDGAAFYMLALRKPSNVTLLGRIGEHRQVKHEIANAGVVCCPSRDEGFGLVAAEAIAMGRHVVATDVGIHREVVGEHGVILPNTAGAADIASAIVVASRMESRPSLNGEYTPKAFVSNVRRLAALSLERGATDD